MKKLIVKTTSIILVLITVLGTIFITANAASYKTGNYAIASSSGVNVRPQINSSSRYGAASKSTTFNVTKISGNWGYTPSIKCANGKTVSGWLCLDYCTFKGKSGHTHNYNGAVLYESAHPHAISVRCTSFDSCGGYKWTGENYYVKSCSQCNPKNTTSSNKNSSSTYSISNNVLTVKGITMSEYKIGSKFENSNYANVNGKRIYTGAKQCYGYACYIQHKLYGNCYHTANSRFPNLKGSEKVTPKSDQELKNLIKSAGVGAHLRTGATVSGGKHSMIVIGITDKGFTIADANSDNTNRVDVRTYTWNQYRKSNFGKQGFRYIEIYK